MKKEAEARPTAIVQADSVKETELAIAEQHRQDVLKILAEIEGDENCEAFEITSEEDYLFAGEILKHVKGQISVLEKRKKAVTKPLNDALVAFRSWYKPPLDQWGKAEKLLKKKIGDWTLAEAVRQEEAVRQIAEAADKGDFDAAHAASEQLVEAREVKGVSVKTVWVLDEEHVDLSLVPREFLTIDTDVVKEYIRSFGKGRPSDMPGLQFKKAAQVRGSKG